MTRYLRSALTSPVCGCAVASVRTAWSPTGSDDLNSLVTGEFLFLPPNVDDLTGDLSPAEGFQGFFEFEFTADGFPGTHTALAYVGENFVTSVDLRTGSPTFGTPEPALGSYMAGQLARRIGLPIRCSGGFTSSKIPDAQAMQETVNSAMASLSESVGEDVPTFDEVREKIEARYSKAKAVAELTEGNVESRMLEIEQAARDVEA